MSFKSIRFTLTLWYAVTLAVILVLFCSFLYLTFRELLYTEVDRELVSIAESIASPTLAPFRSSAPSALDQVLEDFLGSKVKDKYVQLRDRVGKAVAGSSNLRDFRLRLNRYELSGMELGRTVFSIQTGPDNTPFRVVSYPIYEDGKLTEIVQVAASLEHVTEALDKIFLILAFSIPAAVVLLTAGGWFLAGRALRPVELITGTAQKINAENLNQRLAVVNPNDEIGRLAETFNNTLTRLENSFIKIRRFSSDVSHELRTPLTILRGETEVALRWAKDPDEFRAILKSNLDEIKRMSGIMEFLLDLAKADEGKLPLNLEEIELNQLLTTLVQQAGGLGREKGVAVFFEPSAPVTIHGDESRLRQIFLNLLDNAVKHTEGGGEVRVEVGAAGDLARVAVIDTGAGIPAEDLPHIFDRFYRVDKARNRADGGVGLGLAIVKSLTEAHGGKVEVTSEVGKGSVFTIYLPRTAS